MLLILQQHLFLHIVVGGGGTFWNGGDVFGDHVPRARTLRPKEAFVFFVIFSGPRWFLLLLFLLTLEGQPDGLAKHLHVLDILIRRPAEESPRGARHLG